jgi:hypothetical protein
MGYEEGKGLGKQQQGIVDALRPHHLTGRAGLGSEQDHPTYNTSTLPPHFTPQTHPKDEGAYPVKEQIDWVEGNHITDTGRVYKVIIENVS